MLSRGNSSASARPRRAKPSTPVKYRNTALEPTPLDSETARQHAQIAANIAFRRAQSRTTDTIGGREILLAACHPLNANREVPKILHRTQSVRFTGPSAVPSRQLSITRSIAPGAGFRSPKTQRFGTVDTMMPHPNPDLTALPSVSSVYSTPSSYGKLRKAKSMFTPRGGPLVTFANATPKDHEFQPKKYRRLSSDDSRPPPRMADPRTVASFSHQQRQLPYNYDQDAAIQLARDQYLRQLEKQRLKEQPSLLSMKKKS